MLHRLRWFAAGLLTGALGAVWGLYRLRQTRERLTSADQVVDTIGGAVQTVGATVREAWDESREAIREAEQELRDGYVTGRPHLRRVEG